MRFDEETTTTFFTILNQDTRNSMQTRTSDYIFQQNVPEFIIAFKNKAIKIYTFTQGKNGVAVTRLM